MDTISKCHIYHASKMSRSVYANNKGLEWGMLTKNWTKNRKDMTLSFSNG